jgi:NitT/TauT family transport system substrate-binding protein
VKKTIILTTFIISIFLWIVPSGCESTNSTGKMDELRLVGTIGPLSIPLAYMVENNVMSPIAKKVTFTTWSTSAQLQAIVIAGQGDFISLPTNSAATFYNKGIKCKLLDCSIWNILFLVSTDPGISSIHDIKGKRIVVPYQAAVPDAIFKYVLVKQGINPEKDIDIYYAPDAVQASQLLLAEKEKYALLSEPSATAVLSRGAASGLKFYRNLDMNKMWQAASRGKSQSAIAGTIALGGITGNNAALKLFMNEYKKAVMWMLANPSEAGKLGARTLSDQGFNAEVLTKSLESISWRFKTSGEVHDDIEQFLGALMEISVNYTGGRLPDRGFYYE